MELSFDRITFAHTGAVSPLLVDLTAHFVRGWTGIVGANGSGKSTVLRLAAGELAPEAGGVRRSGMVVLCQQRTDEAPGGLAAFMADDGAAAVVLRGKLAIGTDWAMRWETLSHGERKRAQIGVALWREPEVLLVDEPTNHIDGHARALLMETLAAFGGTGLVVSHDRELLDRLCRQCLFLEPPNGVMRPGNYSEARSDAVREETARRAQREVARRELGRLSEVARGRRAEAAQADRKRSGRHLARQDNDGRGKLGLAIVSGKDGQAGRLARQIEARLARAQVRVESLRVRKEHAVGFWVEGSVSPRPWVCALEGGVIGLGDGRRLVMPDLAVQRQERVAVTGDNGLGKSTLIRHLLRQVDLPEERVVYLPQEIDLAQTRAIMAQVQGLSRDQLGQVMTVVSALGSRPERLLRNLEASPGELRKVLLALGVVRRPYLIVMDEPTNHLDLPAIEALEGALRECPCAMVLVSHDEQFLAAVAGTRWALRREGEEVRVRES